MMMNLPEDPRPRVAADGCGTRYPLRLNTTRPPGTGRVVGSAGTPSHTASASHGLPGPPGTRTGADSGYRLNYIDGRGNYGYNESIYFATAYRDNGPAVCPAPALYCNNRMRSRPA